MPQQGIIVRREHTATILITQQRQRSKTPSSSSSSFSPIRHQPYPKRHRSSAQVCFHFRSTTIEAKANFASCYSIPSERTRPVSPGRATPSTRAWAG